MNGTIRYRHNPVSIASLSAFLTVKGGCTNGQREVYFIRALGELPNMGQVLRDMDAQMAEHMDRGGPLYLRPPELPRLTAPEDTAFYSAAYEAWRAGGSIRLKAQPKDPQFSQVLDRATEETVREYKGVKAGATETILKNYVVKLWFWTDRLLETVIPQWSEQSCVKVIADNIQKEQPYLFYYMLTLLGCDVLLLNTRSDMTAPERLKKLSSPLTLGAYGQSVLPPFTRPSKPSPAPQRPPKRTNPPPAAPSRPVSIVHPGRRTTPAAGSSRREKSFEELASLASSIVMIAVHDSQGQAISTGSGIMLGRDGFILTNNHVVQGGRFFAIRIEDDETVYPTDEIIKYNSNLDLAVLRIQRELSPLPIYSGKQKLVRGQKVVAIGSPLGLFNSVSDGIISGFRQIDNVDMIQFTAPISHGSSGGAVLNLFGELIGISTAGINQGQNINLAIGYESIRLFAQGFFRP